MLEMFWLNAAFKKLIRARYDLIGSDRRSSSLFTSRFLSENCFTLLGKCSNAHDGDKNA